MSNSRQSPLVINAIKSDHLPKNLNVLNPTVKQENRYVSCRTNTSVFLRMRYRVLTMDMYFESVIDLLARYRHVINSSIPRYQCKFPRMLLQFLIILFQSFLSVQKQRQYKRGIMYRDY